MRAIREDVSAVSAAQQVSAILEQLEQPEPAPLRIFWMFWPPLRLSTCFHAKTRTCARRRP
eukprot:995556-Alexandrium_andersonii.AAC.1